MTEQMLEHLRKAERRIERGYQTVASYWKQDIMDNDLTVIKNTLEQGLELLGQYIESNAE